MEFKEYQDKATTTAVYPSIAQMVLNTIKDTLGPDRQALFLTLEYAFKNSALDHNLYYAVLGLSGEAGEICNKVKKIMRDDDGEITEEKREQLSKEIGDVLWYVAAACNELSYPEKNRTRGFAVGIPG